MTSRLALGTLALTLLASGTALAQEGDQATGTTTSCSTHEHDGAGDLTRSLSAVMPDPHAGHHHDGYDPNASVPHTGPGPRGGPAPRATPCAPGFDNKLPDSVTKWLASKEMRQHHYMWHLVRGDWNRLPQATKDKLTRQGWKPPRQEGEKGSGADFICMHHEMVKQVNEKLRESGDACYKEVKGWDPVPWDPKDKFFPMPSDEGTGDDSKAPATTAKYKKLVETKYSKDAWLKKQKSIDDVGMEFEDGIHGWFHMHWATENGPADPMKCGATGAGGCDWLGTPFTAHVNPTFWKLHGWIEDRAQQWAKLHNTTLDAACKKANAFSGPGHDHMHMGGGSDPHSRGAGMGNPDDDFNDVVNDLPGSLKKPTFKMSRSPSHR